MSEAEQHLIDVAILMSQDLQEFVDDAIACSGNENALAATQELIADWEAAYAAVGLTEDDHFLDERTAAEHLSYTVGHEIEVEHGEFREYIDPNFCAVPCPFCGSSDIETISGDLVYDDAPHCNNCHSTGASIDIWNTRHSPTLESTVGWHYPKDNADLENMPAPDELVVAYYRDDSGIERGPVIHRPILSTGLHLGRDGQDVFQPITRWCAIPAEDPGRVDAQPFPGGL